MCRYECKVGDKVYVYSAYQTNHGRSEGVVVRASRYVFSVLYARDSFLLRRVFRQRDGLEVGGSPHFVGSAIWHFWVNRR